MSKGHRFNVLWLEDHIEFIKEYEDELKKQLDAAVFHAESYTKAVSLLGERHFDLFVLDIELEGERFTGIQFADLVRSSASYINAPILFVSMHSHFSYRIIAQYRNCSFLKKPFEKTDFVLQCGVLLNVGDCLLQYHQSSMITIPITKQIQIEINPQNISYIEINRGELSIQYIDGRLEKVLCSSGAFKALLRTIENDKCVLKQIHRSVIVNINQIKDIEIQKNTGLVWLFSDSIPKPLGNRYREKISSIIHGIKEGSNG